MKIAKLVFLLLLIAAVPVLAQTPQQMRSSREASMVVTGEVDIQPDGSVSGHRLERRRELPDYVVALVDEAAAGWRFEPAVTDGQPVAARARMSLRLIARPVGDGGYDVSIASGTFGERPHHTTDHVTSDGALLPPLYPHDMVRDRVQGTVFLLLRVSRDGSVEDIATEQVNLRTINSVRRMERWRNRLAGAAESRARAWRFLPPSTGPLVDEDYWVVRLPVDFAFHGEGARPGNWQLYLPGPRPPAPDWMRGSGSPDNDALPPGEVQMAGRGHRLLTPIGG